MLRVKLTALGIAALSGIASAQPQSWQVIVLHPAGASQSYVKALTATMQVGTCFTTSGGGLEGGYWRGSASTWTPLADPSLESEALGLDGGSQVGYVASHAALWHGTPGSRVDLNPLSPSGATSSAVSTKRNIQVGTLGLPFGIVHAALWRGTPESFVDLNPLGASQSYAKATDGLLIGGALAWTGYSFHAAIWNGTTYSMVDLSTPGEGGSEVRSMAPGIQVGYAGTSAAVWRGSAASFVNMNPPGVTWAEFYATTGRVHAGILPQGSLLRAAVNFGTPDSWVGLHQFLPPQYDSFSRAYAVYQDGPTIYVGGSARSSGPYEEAILWIGTDPCYPNCDNSTNPPLLNVLDFACFLNKFAAGDPYANCDGSTSPPVLNVLDFGCFLNRFAAGCS